MLAPPEIVSFNGLRAACIHVVVARDQIEEVMREAITELMSTLAAQEVGPAGPLFSHHFRIDPETFDFEVGVPVAQPITAAGRVTNGTLPACTVARTIYHGPYEGLTAAWEEFSEWLKIHGHMPAADMWQSYVAGPETSSDPANWRTEFNRPLIGQM